MESNDKWTNTLNWLDKHLTYVSVVKENDKVVWYEFVEKESIQKEVGVICDGVVISVVEYPDAFSHAICLYDDEKMETAVVSAFDSDIGVPLPCILSALNLKDVKFH